jgi:pyruvate dehydrogenase E2 component (dihydrolipoamide acetyltransferase)
VAVPVTVPRFGWSMDEGTFVEWLKRDGDRIRVGDALFVLESEKAAENVEAIDAGILRIPANCPKPGDVIPVGHVVAFLVSEGEHLPAADVVKKGDQPSRGMSAANPAGEALESAGPALGAVKLGAHAVSPRARRVARELGVDCSALHGSGRGGRVRERDVRAVAITASGGRLIPLTRIRRLTAARMVAGVTQAAPVTLTTKADATELVAMRDRLKTADDIVPSYTDLVIKLTAVALRQHPMLQAQWRDDGLFVPDAVHIAVAVDTDDGLFAPVLRDVDRLTLPQLATQSRELIALARAGRLTGEHLRDATFTVTNLGMFGIDAFTPIINLPQCAVLGIGRIVRAPAVVGDRIMPRDMLTLSLTFDHRVVDGAPAARFLDNLRQSIERPRPLLE